MPASLPSVALAQDGEFTIPEATHVASIAMYGSCPSILSAYAENSG